MRTRLGVQAAVAALLLTAAPAVAVAEPAPAGGTTPAWSGPAPDADFGQARAVASRSERAQAALAKARELFTVRGARARGAAPVAAPSDATLVLRDLALGLDDLAPADRRTAERILARPTDKGGDVIPGVGLVEYGTNPSSDTCTATGSPDLKVCVHWVTDPASDHAPPGAGDEGLPAWVGTTQGVFDSVWTNVRSMGYRAPLADLGTDRPGPDGRLDVYLADLQPLGIYGYCAVDPTAAPARAMPGYCVVDNDFVGYSGNPLADLQVTAAHEFFHASQYAYNVAADAWLLEGTAAWVEDELYDGVNDNLSYLRLSSLAYPDVPVDFVSSERAYASSVYGSWVWWRFLTERFGTASKTDPTVVRQVWQRVGSGQRTLPALRAVVAGRRSTFARTFADFGVANRIAGRWYDEGRSYARYVAPVPARYRAVLTRKAPSVRRTPRIYHLANQHATFRPGTSLKGTWRLRILLDLPPKVRGSQATVLVHRRGGAITRKVVRLNRRGDGRVVAPFSRKTVSSVTLTLTNASIRMTECGYQGNTSPFSCGGWSRDDDLPFTYTATAVR